MIGAIFGDIIGSPFEFDNVKSKEFPLLCDKSYFTDDTVMTVAVASALLEYDRIDESNAENFKKTLIEKMHYFGLKHFCAGYGGRFFKWLLAKDVNPYNSFGNGSAMRVSPVAWYAGNLDHAIFLAKLTAEVTHNHPEGIKGAVVTAGATYLAANFASKEEILSFVKQYYPMEQTLDEIRPSYSFNETCQGSVPQAMQAFFESESFEDAIRNAVSIGGDSDTIAAMVGGVAEAYYGMDDKFVQIARKYLEDDMEMYEIAQEFASKYCYTRLFYREYRRLIFDFSKNE